MELNLKKNTSRHLLKLFTILLSTSFLLSEAQAMWGDDDSLETRGGPKKPVFIEIPAMPQFPHMHSVHSSTRSGPCLMPIDDRELPPSQPSGNQLVHIAPIYGDHIDTGDAIMVQNRIIEKYSQRPLIQYDTKGDGHCLSYSIRIPRNELVDRISHVLKQKTSTAQEIEDSLFATGDFSSYFQPYLDKRSQMLQWLETYKNSKKWFEAKFAVAAAILDGTNVYIWENVEGFNRLIDFYEQKDTSREFLAKHLAYVQRCHYEIMASPMDPDFESQVAFGELHSSRRRLPPLHRSLYPTSDEIAQQVLKNRREGKINRINEYLERSSLPVGISSSILIEIDPKTGRPRRSPAVPASPSQTPANVIILPSMISARPSSQTPANVIILPSMTSGRSASPASRPDTTLIPIDAVKFNSSFQGPFQPNGAPLGYTLTLDPHQKRGTKDPLSVISRGAGHVTVKGDGYVFYYQIPKEEMAPLKGQTVSFEADVFSDTPGAYIQYWGYHNASSKKLKSSPHTGNGTWEKLRLNFTVDGSASQFFLYPAIMPGVKLGSAVPEVEVRGVSLKKIVPEESLPLAFNSSFQGPFQPNGASLGYTLTLDPAQKRGTKVALSVALRREGHVALTGDGYVFYYQIPKGEMAQLNGQTVSFEADVFSSTPGAYIQYWGYHNASSKKLMSTPHTGSGAWEKLRLNFTVDGSASQFFLYPAIMPGVKEGSPAPVVEIRNVRLQREL